MSDVFYIGKADAVIALSGKLLTFAEIIHTIKNYKKKVLQLEIGEKSRGSYEWMRMYHYFMLNNEDFMKHYHKRSNSETVFHMIKSKFRDNLRSKDKVAQHNELLLKVICHNICVVIQEMYELGINPNFNNHIL